MNKLVSITIEMTPKGGTSSLFDLVFTAINTVTRSPIENVQITLYTDSIMAALIMRASTSTDGKFIFGTMPAGTYYFTATHPDYEISTGQVVAV